MKVPFLDLKAQYESIKEEINEAIQQVLDSCAFSGGPFVEKFEEEWAEYCQCRHTIGIGNGTEALWLALLALDIGEGDEVITVPKTFIATVEAISFCGAKPVFVDIDGKTYTLNPGLLEDAITPKTKAIIPVHLFGQMADMDPIMETARKRGLYVIEDACQAHGAEYKGKRAGSIGDAVAFSFYPGKNLGAYGESGAVVTNNADIDKKIRILRDHGQPKKYYHDVIGFNARMDGLQGAVLSVKLKYLEEWIDARRNKAALYNDMLNPVSSLMPPYEADYNRHIYHLYEIKVKKRGELIREFQSREIQFGIHYPFPVHLQQAYKSLGHQKGNFPVSENLAEELISLPMYPELTREQIVTVTDTINAFS